MAVVTRRRQALQRVHLLLLYALVARLQAEHLVTVAAAQQVDMGYDDCAVCLAARDARR